MGKQLYLYSKNKLLLQQKSIIMDRNNLKAFKSHITKKSGVKSDSLIDPSKLGSIKCWYTFRSVEHNKSSAIKCNLCSDQEAEKISDALESFKHRNYVVTQIVRDRFGSPVILYKIKDQKVAY